MANHSYDVFIDTGINIVLPEGVDPETNWGYDIFKKLAFKKFKQFLNEEKLDLTWEKFEDE